MATTFEEYWDTRGSREDIADHKERARLAYEAGWDSCNHEWEKVRDFQDKEEEAYRPGWYL